MWLRRRNRVCCEFAQTQGREKRSSWRKPTLASRETELQVRPQPLTACGTHRECCCPSGPRLWATSRQTPFRGRQGPPGSLLEVAVRELGRFGPSQHWEVWVRGRGQAKWALTEKLWIEGLSPRLQRPEMEHPNRTRTTPGFQSWLCPQTALCSHRPPHSSSGPPCSSEKFCS